MEQEFGERLKKYRREKNLTQQDLADKLGVSNKTVSRWESGGGYPDVPLLPALAKALGVTVDDLLNEEKPVRTLTRQDGQNLLSFAFAIGGGVLFFLLRLFVPVVVCYLGYLGCMAYGVYLQRYYCYQSKWFQWGNLVMNFFVNLNLVSSLMAGGMALIPLDAERAPLLLMELMRGAGYVTLGAVAAALVLTGITACLVERPRLAVGLRRPTPRWLVPTVGALTLLGFWIPFFWGYLPREVYLYQRWFYWGLLAALVVLCVLLFIRKGCRWGLLPTGVLGLGGLLLPRFAAEYALLRTGEVTWANDRLAKLYPRFLYPTSVLMIGYGVLALLCLILSLVKVYKKEAGK